MKKISTNRGFFFFFLNSCCWSHCRASPCPYRCSVSKALHFESTKLFFLFTSRQYITYRQFCLLTYNVFVWIFALVCWQSIWRWMSTFQLVFFFFFFPLQLVNICYETRHQIHQLLVKTCSSSFQQSSISHDTKDAIDDDYKMELKKKKKVV